MKIPDININVESKTIDALVEKFSSAAGVIWKPFQIKLLAKAEADAAIIKAEGQLQLEDIQKRAAQRIIREETIKQINIESVANKSLSHISAKADPTEIEDDWLLNFTDKCKSVSSGEMQELWGKILAGEINTPGTFSRKTINILQSLSKSDATLFSDFAKFVVKISSTNMPLITNSKDSFYTNKGILYGSLMHLEFLGLIKLNSPSFEITFDEDEDKIIYYFDKAIRLETGSQRPIPASEALFTQAGLELYGILQPTEVKGFDTHIITSYESILIPCKLISK